MSRSTHKLRRRLNSGKAKMFKEKFIKTPDLHSHILPTEIDREGLAEIFFSNKETVTAFVKISGLEPIRIGCRGKKVFDRKVAIETLSKYASNGKLTFDRQRRKEAGVVL